jgi:hypothetical protein
MARIVHEELSRKIIGAAMEVLNKLKPELDLLLINFKNARLEWKRVLRTQERGEVVAPHLHAGL